MDRYARIIAALPPAEAAALLAEECRRKDEVIALLEAQAEALEEALDLAESFASEAGATAA